MKVTIHQPNYLPYVGFFNKVLQSDCLVIYDTAQFVKDRFDNRNYIKVGNEKVLLSVPVKRSSWFQPHKDVEIDNSKPWCKKHWRTIEQAYSKARNFEDYSSDFKEIFSKDYNKLNQISVSIIKKVLEILDWKGKIIHSSSLNLDPKLSSTEAIISILKELGATSYLAGPGSKKYLDDNLFAENNIKLEYQNFSHPTYYQMGDTFIQNTSVLDILFNEGKKARKLILE